MNIYKNKVRTTLTGAAEVGGARPPPKLKPPMPPDAAGAPKLRPPLVAIVLPNETPKTELIHTFSFISFIFVI